jgi:hypothetical protein
LFYIAGTTMMAVEVKTTAGRFEPGIPKALFTLPALDLLCAS